MPLPGVILAAGRSSRMGRDKALIPVGETTWLGRLVEVFSAAVAPVIVVVGHHAEEVAEAAGPELVVVHNRDYDRGMLSSLQSGLRALPDDAQGAVFTLVDHPHLQPETLTAVLNAFEQSRPPMVIPRFNGERGHPVVVRRDVIEELLQLDPKSSPKPVVRSHYPQALFLDLDDPAVTEDLDLPSDLR